MAEIYSTATEYIANEIVLYRGSPASITGVGVYHTTNPNYVPEVSDFTLVTLVDDPLDPLADGEKIDVLSLVGPEGDVALAPGDYQRFVLIKTATENIIRKADVLTVL